MVRANGVSCLLVLLPICSLGAHDDSSFHFEDANGIRVKFHKRHAEFSIYSRGHGEHDEHDHNKISFKIQGVTEVDENGKDIEKRKQHFHHHDVEFDFAHESDVQVGEATANKVSFNASLEAGDLKVETFLIKTKGEVGPNLTDSESTVWDTFAGDVKWNIELSKWKWCGQDAVCEHRGQDKIGKFVDIDIEMKGPKTKPGPKAGKGGKGKKWDLGGGIDIDLTTEVTIDGEGVNMPEGYPMVKTKGDKNVFTLRFPKFNHTAIYDPLVGSSQAQVDSAQSSHGFRRLLAALIPLCLAGFVVL